MQELNPSQIQDHLARHAVKTWHDGHVIRFGVPLQQTSRPATVLELAEVAQECGAAVHTLTFSAALAQTWRVAGGNAKGVQLLDHLWVDPAVRYEAVRNVERVSGVRLQLSNLEVAALRSRVTAELLQQYGSVLLLDLVEVLRSPNGLYLRWDFDHLLREVSRDDMRIELDGTHGKLVIKREAVPGASAEVYSWRLVMRSSASRCVVAAARGYAVIDAPAFAGNPEAFWQGCEQVGADLAPILDELCVLGGVPQGLLVVLSECDRHSRATRAGYGKQLVHHALRALQAKLKSTSSATLVVLCDPAQYCGLPQDVLPVASRVRRDAAQQRVVSGFAGALGTMLRLHPQGWEVVPMLRGSLLPGGGVRAAAVQVQAANLLAASSVAAD